MENEFNSRFFNDFQEKFKKNGALEQQEVAYKTFKTKINSLSNRFEAEINSGTEKTQGKHLRITGYPSAELIGLKKTLEDMGINVEEKYKGSQIMLVVREVDKISSPQILNALEEKFNKNTSQIKENKHPPLASLTKMVDCDEQKILIDKSKPAPSSRNNDASYVFIIDSAYIEGQYVLSHSGSFDDIKNAAKHWARIEGREFDESMIVKLNMPREEYEKKYTENKGTYSYKEEIDKFIKENTSEEVLQNIGSERDNALSLSGDRSDMKNRIRKLKSQDQQEEQLGDNNENKDALNP